MSCNLIRVHCMRSVCMAAAMIALSALMPPAIQIDLVPSAQAQPDPLVQEFNATIGLFSAGKFQEVLERTASFMNAASARYGEDGPKYADWINLAAIAHM